jgi:hypothetical protein
MRWMCGRIAGVTLLATIAAGCGSTSGDDALVFQFVSFDGAGITQADAVRQSSADVDIVQDCCVLVEEGLCFDAEPFTQTIINATFRNNGAADLQLQQVVIDLGPTAGRATVTHLVSGDLRGGRCSNIDQQCSSDADCLSGSSSGSGTCEHTETTISGLLLFSFDDKAHILPGTYSTAITFFASDSVHTFQTRTYYVVTFDDFDNCTISTGG